MFIPENERNILYQKAINQYGEKLQAIVIMEELSELISAIANVLVAKDLHSETNIKHPVHSLQTNDGTRFVASVWRQANTIKSMCKQLRQGRFPLESLSIGTDENVTEEFADVQIMLEQLATMAGWGFRSKVSAMMDKKVNRLSQRLAGSTFTPLLPLVITDGFEDPEALPKILSVDDFREGDLFIFTRTDTLTVYENHGNTNLRTGKQMRDKHHLLEGVLNGQYLFVGNVKES